MKQNQDYKNEALRALSGSWPHSLVATIIYLAILSFLVMPSYMINFGITFPSYISGGSGIIFILIVYPMALGFTNSFRLLYETGDNRLTRNAFSLGFDNWIHNVLGMLLTDVFIVLWSLLFLIPGIIKCFSYAMTPYILVEHPEMSVNKAIDESIYLMDGHKFDYFYLALSFIGWIILSIMSFGIGFFWLIPYMQTTMAAFYADLKKEKNRETVLEAERVL